MKVFLTFIAGLLALPVQFVSGTQSADEIRDSLRAHDHAVHLHDIWVRDPYIILGADGYYYYTGTTQMPEQQGTGDAKFNTGLGKSSLVGWHVQAWRSKDLIAWEVLGSVYTLKDGIWFQTERARFDGTPENQWRLWAPELHWLGSRWALVHTTPTPVRSSNLSLTRGAKLDGSWENPMGTNIAHRHDPSLFKDDDRTWWMLWGATEIAPLKPDFTAFAAEPTRIGPSGETAKIGHEGCLMRKLGSKYVLFGTGWSTGQMRKGSYNLYYATADKITGPYSERKFAGRFLGHGTPFQDKDGRWWCTAFYNANVPPLSSEGIQIRDLSETAQTINRQGLTLVPMDIRVADGDVVIRALDRRYASPGPDERQKFTFLAR